MLGTMLANSASFYTKIFAKMNKLYKTLSSLSLYLLSIIGLFSIAYIVLLKKFIMSTLSVFFSISNITFSSFC